MAALAPRFIHLIYTEDWNGVATFVSPFLNSEPVTPQLRIMNLTILCHEDWARIREAETTALSAGSYLKYTDVRAITVPEEICRIMPRPKAEALYGPIAASSVPVLPVNGELDPQDPPDNAAGAKQYYPNSQILVAPGQGHGYTGIPCLALGIQSFILYASQFFTQFP